MIDPPADETTVWRNAAVRFSMLAGQDERVARSVYCVNLGCDPVADGQRPGQKDVVGSLLPKGDFQNLGIVVQSMIRALESARRAEWVAACCFDDTRSTIWGAVLMGGKPHSHLFGMKVTRRPGGGFEFSEELTDAELRKSPLSGGLPKQTNRL